MAKTSSNIVYACWSNKDDLLTQNYFTKFKVPDNKIYLKSKNLIKPIIKN